MNDLFQGLQRYYMPDFLLGRRDEGPFGCHPRVEMRVRNCQNVLGLQWDWGHVYDGDINWSLVVGAHLRMARDYEVWVEL